MTSGTDLSVIPRAHRVRAAIRLLHRGAGVILALAAVLAVPITPAEAQVSSGADLRIDVLEGLSIFRSNHLRFGSRVSGSGAHTIPVTSADAGRFRIVGMVNTDVQVTLSPPTALALQGDPSQTIPYAWAAHYNNQTNDPSGATGNLVAFTGPTAVFRLRNNPSIGGNIRQAWVYIHGTITVGTVPAGNYRGTFQIQAVYN